MGWNYRRFGTADQPIHKSDLNELSGSFACPKRFQFARSTPPEDKPSSTVSAKTAFGNATHEVLSRVLSHEATCKRVLKSELPPRRWLELALEEEVDRASEGRELDLGKDTYAQLAESRLSMLIGALQSLPSYAHEVVATEIGFTVELGGLHFAGHVDLLFRPRAAPDTYAFADWKSGATKPHPIELAHGWESGIYSLALSRGQLMRRAIDTTLSQGLYTARCNAHEVTRASRWQAERDAFEACLISLAQGRAEDGAFRLGEFPSAIYHVQLADFVPYVKAGRRLVSRPDELEHYGYTTPTTHSYVAGDMRGPGWLRVERHERDIPRLAYRARAVAALVRMGRFIDVVNEQCMRCPYKAPCLNSGYAPIDDDLAKLEQTLKAAGL